MDSYRGGACVGYDDVFLDDGRSYFPDELLDDGVLLEDDLLPNQFDGLARLDDHELLPLLDPELFEPEPNQLFEPPLELELEPLLPLRQPSQFDVNKHTNNTINATDRILISGFSNAFELNDDYVIEFGNVLGYTKISVH